MKPSQELPGDWKWCNPAEVASPERNALAIGPFGSNLRVEDYRDEGIPLVFVRNIRAEDFEGLDRKFVSPAKAEELRSHIVQGGDVLVTKMGDPPGDSALYPRRLPAAVITADCIKWRVASPNVPEFFVYAIRSPQVKGQIVNQTRGVAQRKVSLGRFKAMWMPVAPPDEQRQIVQAIETHFTRLDAAVANLERARANLKRYRASVLQAAVEGRLVPTEAALARREGRPYEPASVLLERILAERRRRWGEAELEKLRAKGKEPKGDGWKKKYKEPAPPDVEGLPELPEGWCWATVDQLAVVSGGLTKNARRSTLPRKVPYLRVANVYADRLELDEVKEIGVRDEEELRKVLLEPDDLLVVEGNGSPSQIGRVALWDGSIDSCAHQNHLIKARFLVGGLSRWSLMWLLSPSGRECIRKVASSTSGLYNLSLSKVRSLPTPLPPFDELETAVEMVDALLSEEDHVEAALRNLGLKTSRLTKAILKSAFEGRLLEDDRR